MKTFRPIKLTNTTTGKKELFEPRTPGKVGFYSCGPTVYNFIHIGNLRGGLVADMVFKYFKRVGYDVNFVRNYTDVDDKIINRGKEEKIPAEEVAKKYTLEVEKDFAVAGMEEPTHKTTVTTHIPDIITLIQKIIANGQGYVVDGEVFFSIEKFPTYGKLSRKPIEDLIAGIRVEVRDKKKSPLDFSLWKPAKEGEPFWESPWGKGRPGWHIECSAMASRWLGDQIDLHHGGEDLIFPHHENEIAQSEAASKKAPFVKYWLHHAFLTVSKEKMSKSIGNVFLAREFLTKYGGEIARYILLGVHYRSIIDFDEGTIDQALTSLHRIYEAKAKARELAAKKAAVPDLRAESAWGSFVADAEQIKTKIDDHYANDFNTPGVLGELFSLIREFNKTLATPLAESTPSAVLGAQALLQVMEQDVGGVLGVGRADPKKMLGDIATLRSEGKDTSGRPSAEEIESLIQARLEARKAKNFAESDRIRDELLAKGVAIKDGPKGTTWEYK
ncbi:cysteine--tRNA ligase [bacterium]|jgi:cysteinyl-tRNA synthetase|nr:cysteine--tRNA ligase [bacterium]